MSTQFLQASDRTLGQDYLTPKSTCEQDFSRAPLIRGRCSTNYLFVTRDHVREAMKTPRRSIV